MKHFFTLTLIGIIALCNFGCSSDEEPSDVDSPTMPSMENPLDGTPEVTAMSDVVPLPDDVVLESMDETEAEKLEDKTPVQIVTVLEGTQRVTIAARFRGVRYLGFGFPLYECELMSDDVEKMGGIAAGMSGSPVGPPGKVMGALAYGNYFSASPTRFWVTSIEAMESARDHLTFGDELEEHLNAAPSARINAAYAPVKTPLKITGIKPNRLQHIESYLKGSHFDYIELFADVGSAPIMLSTDRDLMAGDMIGVAVSTGDVVNAIGFGTVTQVYDDNTFVAFGHPFSAFGDGKTALPVYRATVNGLVPNLQNTYKSVSAYGDPIGTVTKDLIPGIVGELGEAPNTIPFSIKYQRGNDVIEKEHQVAYGYESYIPIIAAVTQDAIRLETSPTTIEATITLSFEESEKDYTETFLSAAEDTYIETFFNTQRIISTFTDRFTNITGKATLTSVELTMTEKPQIMTAVIQEIIPPDQIVRGATATFTVVLLPHWTAVQNGERKIEKQITLSIPSDYSRGDAWISVFSKDPEDSFFGFDFDFDFDSDSESEALPENLDELIDKLHDEQNEDPGVITIVLSDEIVLPDELILDEPKNEITLEGFIVTGAESDLVEIE